MRSTAWFLGLVAVLALTTWFIAWWTVPIIAGAWGFLRRRDPAAPLAAGLAAMVAWGVLVLLASRGAPAGSVLRSVGAAMQVGPGALGALTIAFPALVAASAAGLVRAVTAGRR